MIEKLKENIAIGIPLALVFAFYYMWGYYLFFQIDIVAFMTLEDIILVFLKDITTMVLLCFTSSMLVLVISDKNYMQENTPQWLIKLWQITIFKRIRIVGVLLVLSISAFLGSAILFKMVGEIFSILIALTIFILIIYYLIRLFSTKKDLNEIKKADLAISILGAIIIFIFLPIIIGHHSASIHKEHVCISFINGTKICTKDSTNMWMAGKTKDFVFVFKKDSNQSTAYSISQISSIEIYRTAGMH
jgi:hypothetical protein